MLVIGVDGGGTSTRCVVATADGEIVARGRAGGSNQRSSADPAGSLWAALAQALAGVDPLAVAGGVIGLAGAGAAGRAAAELLAARAWESVGLPGRPVVVPDIEVAYAAGTDAAGGVVLIAGTGAVAARIEDRRIARRADGYGWLLGDEGSGVWIGRHAVAAVLSAQDGRGAPTQLSVTIPAALGVGGEPAAQAIVKAVHAAEPATLGSLSPLVEAAARDGDAVAWELLVAAADRLLRTVGAVTDGSEPIVLAGGLLTAPTVVAELVRAGLAARDITVARDGAAGAAALALHTIATTGALDSGATHQAHRHLIH